MIIGIDASVFLNKRGYGRHARALFTNLLKLDSNNRYVFFIDFKEDLEELPSNASWQYVSASKPASKAARANGSRSIKDLLKMSNALSRPGFDILIFPTVYSYVPVRSRARKILFIHDVISETYPGMTLPGFGSRWLWKIKTWMALRQADILLTVSQYSRSGIAEYFRVDPRKIGVVGEAPDGVFKPITEISISQELVRKGIDSDRRLILYVGGFGPHKNVRTLLRALQELIGQPGFEDVQLVLVGENNAETFYSEFQSLNEFVNDHLKGFAIFTGYLMDEQLVQLLNRACVLVLPSWLEGYGLPAIEAAACGCPVIATRCSPLPEILGDSALFFNPGEVNELAAHLKTVLRSEDTRQRMRQGGLQAVSKLNWAAAANQLLYVLHSQANIETPA